VTMLSTAILAQCSAFFGFLQGLFQL